MFAAPMLNDLVINFEPDYKTEYCLPERYKTFEIKDNSSDLGNTSVDYKNIDLPEYYNNNFILFEFNFKKLTGKYSKIKIEKNAQSFFNETALSLSNIRFSNLIMGYTSSNSLFFSFNSIDLVYEFNMEVFLDYNKDDSSDVQSTLNYFIKGAAAQKSYYGSIKQISGYIRDILNPKNINEIYKNIYKVDYNLVGKKLPTQARQEISSLLSAK